MQALGNLQPQPPYDFQLMLDLLARYTHPIVDAAHDGAYWRVLREGHHLALVRVRDLEVALVSATGPVDGDRLMAQIRHILGTDTSLAPFYDFARTQPGLWSVVQPLVGLHWLRSASLFEALMLTIIEQQIAWTAAQQAQRWLVEWGGHTITHAGRSYFAFPTQEQIATATIDDLRPLKITFKRMRTMIDVAATDLESLRRLSIDEAYQRLIQLKGIGHWTATWTLQRTFGPHRFVGQNDVALQAAVNHYFYGGQGRIPEAQVIETFAEYGEYAGIAAHYVLMRWVMDRYTPQT
jgi:DNA-3-methyladenine glycosylase II